MGGEKVGKEKELQDGEDDEQLDENDGPQGLAQRHVAETVSIEVIGPIEKTLLVHRLAG